MTSEALNPKGYAYTEQVARWCSAGHHYAKPIACIFSDPGDCEVYVCGPCARKVADALAATAEEKQG